MCDVPGRLTSQHTIYRKADVAVGVCGPHFHAAVVAEGAGILYGEVGSVCQLPAVHRIVVARFANGQPHRTNGGIARSEEVGEGSGGGGGRVCEVKSARYRPAIREAMYPCW